MATCTHCNKLVEEREPKCPYCGNAGPYKPDVGIGLPWALRLIAAAALVYMLAGKPAPNARDPEFVAAIIVLEMISAFVAALLLLSIRASSSWAEVIKVLAATVMCVVLLMLKGCEKFGTEGLNW